MAEEDQPAQLARTSEPRALAISRGRYEKKQTCPGCDLTKADRDQMTFQADYDDYVDPPPSCRVCADGRRFGRKVTPPRLPGAEGQEECCSLAPRWLRSIFGARGTRKRRGAKKRGTKKRRGTKKHGSKKRHGKKRRGSKKRGRSRKHHRGGNGCGSRKRKRKSKRMYGGSNSHLSPMAINSELTRQQLRHVPPTGTGALAV